MFEKKHQNSGTLGKDTINKWIISFLSVRKRGFKSNFDLASIFLLILKRLKTEVQWRELPIEVYFEKGEISWQNVYYYFNKWSKDGSFQHPRNGEQPDVYFDEELYKNRFKIEQTNGWLDGYKGLIMRYEYLDVT
ncbi:transposase [Capnocytophaga gingivalis]|uniref:Transposase n=1 Tax=Capnocytophaga gingivalis TaxID=1017 RepID=A0ABU5ZE87_9FLAO|nr:transposase [Capnocytophaga gingivalis]MEB3075846.1 transposase [Capnocytophaga gingivalis]